MHNLVAELVPAADKAPVDWSALFPPGLLDELESTSFVRECRAGAVPLPALRAFLVQHQYYSQHFVRYLCAVMSSLPDAQAIRALALNLIDELGLDAPDRVTHADLYHESLQSCGVQIGSVPMQDATRGLIDSMFSFCRSGDPLVGLSALCLGAEAIVPTLYSAIIHALRAVNVAPAGLRFFELHVHGDEAHALVMRSELERLLKENPERIADVHKVATEVVRRRIRMLDAVYAPLCAVA